MPYTIAVAGKGGTGKTTLSGLIVRHLVRGGKTPILAVDADPNANLNEALGLTFDHTVVSTVDGFMAGKESMPTGVPRDRYLEFEVEDALVESKGFDLLVMGHTEGPGCYCRANDLLRGFVERLAGNYPRVVMDNEAGLEHLSRRTTGDVDVLLVVATPSAVALRSARRIHETVGNLKLGIKRIFLVVNELAPAPGWDREKAAETAGLPLLGVVPYDEEVARRSVAAEGVLDLSDTSPAVGTVAELMDGLSGA